MMVLNGIHTCCVDVVELHGLVNFIQEASEIMTGFCSMAAGQKMKFPTVEIADKVIEKYKETEVCENKIIVIKIEEMLIYNSFEISINIIIPPATISIQDTEFMAGCKKLMVFCAVPESSY